MKRKIAVLIVLLVASFTTGFGQTGISEDFNDNSLSPNWAGSASYTLTEANQELKVVTSVSAGVYNVFTYSFDALDLIDNPYLKIKIKTAANVRLRVDFEDITGKSTNTSGIVMTVAGGSSYQTLTYNFTGRFSQTYPTVSPVDPTKITKVVIFVNPGGTAFNGTLYFDDLQVGSATGILPPPGNIKINQLGFYPNAPKAAIGVTGGAGPFYILSSNLQDTVYSGTLGASASFNMTGEIVRKADFTNFTTIGNYYLNIPGVGNSHPFSIKPNVHHEVSKAGLKGFYYQRASTALQSQEAGIWARAKGHADNSVIVHNSAANGYRPTGTIISSPRGWYDAGDYNKYVVNAGISTYMLLSMYEHYPSYFDTLNLHIPESGNALPDVLDEALWEVRWLLTMQDPYDGGVYFKVTSPFFDGTVMPAASLQQRYVVQKSTSATLDFAAIMAQTARIVKLYETQLPGLADSCINASVKAWKWARKNPSVKYVQSQISNPAINTGEYGDGNLTDEFQWAGMELYATTRLDSFYTKAGALSAIYGLSWGNVRALGYFSLAHMRKSLTPIADTSTIKAYLSSVANGFRTAANSSPYGITLSANGDFNWGSNGNISNHSVYLLNTFELENDSSYLKTAISNLDYLMGKNGTNYCFMTGYGSVSPMDIHHRISGADGITAPVPGLLAGGPNTDDQSDCGSGSYPSNLKGKAYLDAYCSYSTNEIAINWNAPFAYLGNVVEAIESGAISEVLNYVAVLPTNTIVISDTLVIAGVEENQVQDLQLTVYPNPAKDKLTVEFVNFNEAVTLTMTDVRGSKVFEKENSKAGNQSEQFDLSGLNKGLYYLLLKSGSKTEAKKIIVE